jgi:hypothetical protein
MSPFPTLDDPFDDVCEDCGEFRDACACLDAEIEDDDDHERMGADAADDAPGNAGDPAAATGAEPVSDLSLAEQRLRIFPL